VRPVRHRAGRRAVRARLGTRGDPASAQHDAGRRETHGRDARTGRGTGETEEGRLVDFLTEEIAGYSDEQIGAATRGIHDACAKALRGCVSLEPVLPGREDETVTVPAGFDPASIRLSGNVHGGPPFTGTLRHGGWRVKAVTIPARTGLDPKIVAPAEVEIA
jgi:hypothetical protein